MLSVRCPNTAWLLIVVALVVLFLLVSASVYLTKKKVSMSALSIGVDFMQILSIFVSFNFGAMCAVVDGRGVLIIGVVLLACL